MLFRTGQTHRDQHFLFPPNVTMSYVAKGLHASCWKQVSGVCHHIWIIAHASLHPAALQARALTAGPCFPQTRGIKTLKSLREAGQEGAAEVTKSSSAASVARICLEAESAPGQGRAHLPLTASKEGFGWGEGLLRIAAIGPLRPPRAAALLWFVLQPGPQHRRAKPHGCSPPLAWQPVSSSYLCKSISSVNQILPSFARRLWLFWRWADWCPSSFPSPSSLKMHFFQIKSLICHYSASTVSNQQTHLFDHSLLPCLCSIYYLFTISLLSPFAF